MKTPKVTLNYEFTNLGRVRIINDMAPLTISQSETGKIEIEADLNVSEQDIKLNFERYFNVDYTEPVAVIELEDIPEIADGFLSGGRSQVRIYIPAGVSLEAESDNLPLTLAGLSCQIKVQNENGPVIVSNCYGDIELENENGPIKLHNCEGNLVLTQENGPVSGEALSGESLKVETENGAIKIRSASYLNASVTSENGMIYYETLPIDGGSLNFATENGVVHLVLPEGFDFELQAETETGALKCHLDADVRNEAGVYVIRKGEGKNQIRIKTENGVIKIGSDGYMNLSFLRLKLAELKETILNSKTLDDKAKAQKVLKSVIEALEKAAEKIPEAKIRETIKTASDKLQATVENFDVGETKDKVVSGVEKIGEEVSNSLREFLLKVKYTEPGQKFRSFDFHKEFGNVKDYIGRVIDTELKPYLGKRGRDLGEVGERSRIKILEMLESGKITAEEAERLLKAIGKE